MKPGVLHVTTTYSTVRAFLTPFAEHFRSRGWEVDAAAAGINRSPECRAAFSSVHDLAWSRELSSICGMFAAARQVCALVQERRYDLVHVHTPIAAFTTRLALREARRRFGCQVVYTAHGLPFHKRGRPGSNALFRTAEMMAGEWTDFLAVMNAEDDEAATALRLVPRSRLWNIPGIGIDLSYFDPARVSETEVARVRAEIGLRQGDVLLLMPAELSKRKRPQDALDAFTRVARPGVFLALAGEGPLLNSLRSLVARTSLEKSVLFLGFRRDIRTLLRAAAGAIVVSSHEGLCRAVMEAMAMERAVVGTRARGISDLLTEDSGFLVNVGDIDGIAAAMRQLLDNPHRAARLGEAGRRRLEPYSIRQILANYETLYDAALARRYRPGEGLW